MSVQVNAYVHACIFVCGLLGNVISFVIYCRKRFKVTIFHIYFRLHVVSDSIVLFQALDVTINYASGGRLWIENLNSFLCSFIEYTYFAACPISGHILVVFTIDRYLSVKYPAKFAWKKKSIFQYAVCAAIIVYNLAVYTNILVVTSLIEANHSHGTNKSSAVCLTNSDMAFNGFDTINSSLGPFVAMIVFTSLTIKAIFDSRKRSQTSTPSSARRDIKFAIVAIGYNVIFIVLTLPMLLFVTITDPRQYEEDVFYLITVKLFQANFCMNFFKNIAINSLFREEFVNLFLCK